MNKIFKNRRPSRTALTNKPKETKIQSPNTPGVNFHSAQDVVKLFGSFFSNLRSPLFLSFALLAQAKPPTARIVSKMRFRRSSSTFESLMAIRKI